MRGIASEEAALTDALAGLVESLRSGLCVWHKSDPPFTTLVVEGVSRHIRSAPHSSPGASRPDRRGEDALRALKREHDEIWRLARDLAAGQPPIPTERAFRTARELLAVLLDHLGREENDHPQRPQEPPAGSREAPLGRETEEGPKRA
jgi:hypothetical protein